MLSGPRVHNYGASPDASMVPRLALLGVCQPAPCALAASGSIPWSFAAGTSDDRHDQTARARECLVKRGNAGFQCTRDNQP